MIHGVNNVNKMHCLQRGISISFFFFFFEYPIKFLGYNIIKNIFGTPCRKCKHKVWKSAYHLLCLWWQGAKQLSGRRSRRSCLSRQISKSQMSWLIPVLLYSSGGLWPGGPKGTLPCGPAWWWALGGRVRGCVSGWCQEHRTRRGELLSRCETFSSRTPEGSCV